MKNLLLKAFRLLLLATITTSCGSYYHKNSSFHKHFLKENIAEADHVLAKKKNGDKGRNRLLYCLNRGITHHLMQDYETSNAFFEQAYIIHEDFVANPCDVVLTFLVNPTLTDYKGEDHEILLIHYYKALNYLHLGNLSAALVECRRLNIQLNILSDKYNSANTYRRDAFIHLLMGLIYQADHAYNDAFIAYRNAFEIYEEDYTKLFGIEAPLQLKKDLIYTAYKTGFHDAVTHYLAKFQLDYDPSKEDPQSGDIVCLWNNGLGPVKDEWGLNFVMIEGVGGVVNFVNEDLGLTFPFPLCSDTKSQLNVSDLHLFRISFPTYVERPLLYQQATIRLQNSIYQLEIIEDINAISFRILHERMLWELSKSLLRVAIKKVTEYQVRKQNAILGTLVGVVNFATEKADTRNWQTIPHTISYTRIRLREGSHSLTFQAAGMHAQHDKNHTFSIDVHPQQTIFYPVYTLQQGAQS